MANTVFIYSRRLTDAQVALFAEKSAATCVKRADLFGYKIAFFTTNSTACRLRDAAAEIECDIADLAVVPQLNQAGLLLMDMDSTAIKIECIDEIAELAGTGEAVSAVTAAAMRGELDFEQSLRKRVATLAGAPESILQEVREKLPLTEGFETLIGVLKQHGWKIAIASGGFDYFADYLKEKYDLDYAVSNRLEIRDGKLTGKVSGKVVDAKYKEETLKKLGQTYRLPQNQWVAVGDGANDLPMLKAAAMGVALHAKPKVREQAEFVVNFGDLSALALLLSARTLLD